MAVRYFVEANKITRITGAKCNKKKVGEKAYGLLTMPSSWTPAFFVISKKLYKSYVESSDSLARKQIIDTYIDSINICIKKLNLESKELIIRSSGLKEGMSERGNYESYKCTYENFKEVLIKLINDISTIGSVPLNEMPFVVQEHIAGGVIGHLSNEYRFSKDIRDWKYQTFCNGETSPLLNVAVRNWREKFDTSCIEENLLEAPSLKQALRLLASYYTNKKCRRHIEFIYINNRLFAVQADEESQELDAIDPTKYNVKMQFTENIKDLKVLRLTNEEDELKYHKIRNVAVYHSVGITTVPLYVLDDTEIISELSKNISSAELEHDLSILLGRSIVIRCDITPYDQKNAQLLQRSNELKNIDEAREWLFKNSSKILEKNGVFIFHNFVPAVAAAFAYAKPQSRKVEIQSLWGIPDGLYYNAHDRIVVDTKFAAIDKMDYNKITEKDIKKILQYKPSCIFPEPTGEWKLNKIASPYNWKCSISDNESIKQIAIESRKIAEYEKKAISIMWFVGIDKDYYQTKNLPWHHEEYSIDSYTNDSYKRKYFSDEELIIRKESDINVLTNNSHIKCIRLQPDDDATLRNREFIKNVGKCACENGISILLEGAVLAHSFYQLRNTGANVVVAQPFEEYSDELEFNKLVRDKIPQNILEGGENVQCAVADDSLYLYLLINKLLEEAYEAYDASDNELLYELVDIYQVCDSIVSFQTEHLWIMPRTNSESYDSTACDRFSFKHYLESKEYYPHKIGDYEFSIALSRKKQFYEIEIKGVKGNDIPRVSKYTELPKKSMFTELVDMSSQMLTCTDIIQIKNLANGIMNKIKNEILCQLSITIESFQKAINDKTQKNGAFKNKYLLLKTKFSGEVVESDGDATKYHIKRDIYVKAEKTIELLKSPKRDTLLLRKKVPIGYTKFYESFSGEKVNEFFGESSRLQVYLSHQIDNIHLDIVKEKLPEYKQLEFIF